MFILCVSRMSVLPLSPSQWPLLAALEAPWKPGVYRARASLAPIPLALVLMEASTELRTRGLSNIGIIVRSANLTPRASLYLLTKSFVNTTLAGDASLWDVRRARRRTDTHCCAGSVRCQVVLRRDGCGCL